MIEYTKTETLLWRLIVAALMFVGIVQLGNYFGWWVL